MKRRSFLGAMLAACAAPAIVKAEILMPGRGIIVPQQEIVRGPFFAMPFDDDLFGLDMASKSDVASYVVFVHPDLHKEFLGGIGEWGGVRVIEAGELPPGSWVTAPAGDALSTLLSHQQRPLDMGTLDRAYRRLQESAVPRLDPFGQRGHIKGEHRIERVVMHDDWMK